MRYDSASIGCTTRLTGPVSRPSPDRTAWSLRVDRARPRIALDRADLDALEAAGAAVGEHVRPPAPGGSRASGQVSRQAPQPGSRRHDRDHRASPPVPPRGDHAAGDHPGRAASRRPPRVFMSTVGRVELGQGGQVRPARRAGWRRATTPDRRVPAAGARRRIASAARELPVAAAAARVVEADARGRPRRRRPTRRSITSHGVCRSDRRDVRVVVAERRAEQRRRRPARRSPRAPPTTSMSSPATSSAGLAIA